MPKPGIELGAAAWDPLALPTELLRDWWWSGINLWTKMQQNHLLYCMHIQRDLFGGLASILGCPRAFSRLPTLEDWPFRPLRGLKGQISRLAASLRPRQPKISARQPKKSCCLCIQCNRRFCLIFGQRLKPLQHQTLKSSVGRAWGSHAAAPGSIPGFGIAF